MSSGENWPQTRYRGPASPDVDAEDSSSHYLLGNYKKEAFKEAARYTETQAKGAQADGHGPHSEVNQWSLMNEYYKENEVRSRIKKALE